MIRFKDKSVLLRLYLHVTALEESYAVNSVLSFGLFISGSSIPLRSRLRSTYFETQSVFGCTQSTDTKSIYQCREYVGMTGTWRQ